MKKRLKDQIKWEPSREQKQRKHLSDAPYFVKPVEDSQSEITIPGDEVLENPEVIVTERKVNADNLFRQRARRFVELIEDGVKPGAAANNLHCKLGDLMSDKHVKERVKEAIEEWHLNNDIRKLLVRALTNKLMVEGAASDTVAEKKLALEAAKLISADPEVGLQQQGPIVTIDMSGLGALLAQPAPSLPGIEAPKEENNSEDPIDIQPES